MIQAPDQSPLYTVEEAAKYLRLSGVKSPSRTMYRYIRLGELATVRMGRFKLLHKAELDRFIAQKFAEQNARPLPESDPPRRSRRRTAAMKTLNLENLVLRSGGHKSRDDGVCAMEAAAWLAGEKHSDQPECVCPQIGAFMRAWNDGLPSDDDRNRLLKPLLPRILNTKGSAALEMKRSYMAWDWYVRVFVPAWLVLTPSLAEHAKSLETLAPIVDDTTVTDVEKKLAAARAAAWAAAWDAARAAAGDAAWAAARAAAWDAAGDAAWAAARAAAWAAAGDAAWAAAWAAAWDAAGEKLAPTVSALQASAVELVERMCEAK